MFTSMQQKQSTRNRMFVRKYWHNLLQVQSTFAAVWNTETAAQQCNKFRKCNLRIMSKILTECLKCFNYEDMYLNSYKIKIFWNGFTILKVRWYLTYLQSPRKTTPQIFHRFLAYLFASLINANTTQHVPYEYW